MGFFFEDIAETSKRSGDTPLKVLHTLECRACPLDKASLRTPKMLPSGPPDPDIYVFAEAPGEDEDLAGEPLVGKSGTLLRKYIPRKWADRIRMGNTIRCRPTAHGNNRAPTETEVECCRPFSIKDIEAAKPKVIFGFGATVLNWLIGETAISEWRGRYLPVTIGTHTCWFFPMYHPSFVLRSQRSDDYLSDVHKTFIFDLKRAFFLLDVGALPKPVIPTKESSVAEITCLEDCSDTDLDLIESFLESIDNDKQEVGVDFETNRLRPYVKGKILTIAISSRKKTLAFPIHHSKARWSSQQLKRLEAMVEWFLLESLCWKIAHNLSFELEWGFYFYGVPKIQLQKYHDTMAMLYCLDERRELLGLDAATHILFGFRLKSWSNIDLERVDSYPLNEVLPYNGLDALYTRKVAELLMPQIRAEGLESSYIEQIERIPTMVLTQLSGINVDQDKREELRLESEKKLEGLRQQVLDLEVAKEFRRLYGKDINPASPQDLTIAFHDILNRPEGIRGNKYSTDESVLKQIDHPLSNLVLDLRTVARFHAMYLEGLAVGGKSLQEDGYIHTLLNTMFTTTGRLSSDSPNIQNFPKREDAWIRVIIIPRIGDRFVAVDYGQIEVRVIAMCSKDKVLVKMLFDRYDMHMDWGERFARRYPKLLKDAGSMKAMRQLAKNQIVFPAFYGASPKSIAGYIGVDELGCTELMEEFWDIFQGVKKWQWKLRKFYDENGYVECLTGRRRHHPLSTNQIINTPVQGTASDMVVDAMKRLSWYSQREDKPQFQAKFNIHDDLMFSIPTKSLDDDTEFIVKTMLFTNYKFVNVPLSAEVSVGKNWYEMETIGGFFSDEW